MWVIYLEMGAALALLILIVWWTWPAERPDNAAELVAKVPLFSSLDAARIASVAGVLRPRRAARGERLIKKGEQADAMYFIVAGEVEVDPEIAAPKGRLAAGDFFGEIALIAERTRTATITALSPCKLLVLKKGDFEAFMSAHPALRDAVRAAAKRRLEELGGG